MASHQLALVPHLSLAFSADELGEAAAASPQRHPVQADLRGAGEQHPAGHHERDVCLRGGEEERMLQQVPGAGAAGGELHERRLQERPDVWLQHQLPVQGRW